MQNMHHPYSGFLKTCESYLYAFANLLLSLWCYSLKNKINLLETHAQII